MQDIYIAKYLYCKISIKMENLNTNEIFKEIKTKKAQLKCKLTIEPTKMTKKCFEYFSSPTFD